MNNEEFADNLWRETPSFLKKPFTRFHIKGFVNHNYPTTGDKILEKVEPALQNAKIKKMAILALGAIFVIGGDQLELTEKSNFIFERIMDVTPNFIDPVFEGHIRDSGPDDWNTEGLGIIGTATALATSGYRNSTRIQKSIENNRLDEL